VWLCALESPIIRAKNSVVVINQRPDPDLHVLSSFLLVAQQCGGAPASEED